MTTFEPPRLTGSEAQQLVQLKSYLFQLSDKLNTALSNLDENNFAANSTARTVVSGSLGGEAAETVNQAAATLKALIIKTANDVRAEIDVITTTLEGSYVAASEFGTYQETIAAQLTAMPDYVMQEIDYNATITSINASLGVLEAYQVETSGRIKAGIVYYDGATPIVGIAIGQELATTGSTEEVGGNTYDVIDKKEFSVVLTARKLAFYQGEAEVAYLSNSKLYITNATITGKLALGTDWEISSTDGYTIKWTGG